MHRGKKNKISRLAAICLILAMLFSAQNVFAADILPIEADTAVSSDVSSETLPESDVVAEGTDAQQNENEVQSTNEESTDENVDDSTTDENIDDSSADAQPAVTLEEPAPKALVGTVLINEVETEEDYVEIINIGAAPVELEGWYILDDKGIEDEAGGEDVAIPLAAKTLAAGEIFVIEKSVHDVGLGNADAVNLFNASGEVEDRFAWAATAFGSWQRVIGSTTDDNFVDQPKTKGTANEPPPLPPPHVPSPEDVVINEVNSSPGDYIELTNIGTETIDISGFVLTDADDDHRWKFPAGSEIAVGEFLVVDPDSVGLLYDDVTGTYAEGAFEPIGIGSGDSVRLYKADEGGALLADNLLDEYSWEEHASVGGNANGEAVAAYGRYPDGTGSFGLVTETPGAANAWYKPEIVVNEVAQDLDPNDWVEIYNNGTRPINIKGWYVVDNDPKNAVSSVIPIENDTILQPGQFFVFEGEGAPNENFLFGLGKEDEVHIYNQDGLEIDTYAWAAHANGVYARIPDGTGAMQEFGTATKGKPNLATKPVVINEVQSNDADGGADWVELANTSDEAVDISGLVIKDDDDEHVFTIPNGTSIAANGFLVIYEEDGGLTFGFGKGDTVRLYEGDMLISSTKWPDDAHTNPTWGLYPNVDGNTYQNTMLPTPGAANKYADIPDVAAWPGNGTINTFDQNPTFFEDSSGLDFHNGQLYAVDNGTGTFWVMDVLPDGTPVFEGGGRRIRYQHNAGDAKAAGPDTEGITVDGDGLVYVASERDNGNSGVNMNMILQADPSQSGTDLIATKQWLLTPDLLPEVNANVGIEAVEWVSFNDVQGKLLDESTGLPFDKANYPNAEAAGIFFVALEDNGHVYGYVLNSDGTGVKIADIDPKIGGAMGLDFDTYEKVLWVMADDGFANTAAKISFGNTRATSIVHIAAPSGVDKSRNTEGFAIAPAEFTVNGQRPVYRFADGFTSGALTMGYMQSNYVPQEDINAADDVTQSINALPTGTTITLNNKAAIVAARAAYNALSPAQQALVSADVLAKLVAAEAKIAELEAADKDQDQGGGNTGGGNTGGGNTGGGTNVPPVENITFAAPQTGDTSNMSLWVTLALVLLAGMVCFGTYEIFKKRKSDAQ